MVAACGYTDENGVFCGKVPKNSLLTIEVSVPDCPELITSFSVGPFSENVQLDEIIIEKEAMIVSGIVECIDDPVTDGYIIATIDGLPTFYLLNDDGTYSINVANGCAVLEEATLQAYNAATGEASSSVVVDLTTNDAIELNLNTCNDCGFEMNIEQTMVSGCMPNEITAVVTGGSGNFRYEWSNGEITATISPDAMDINLFCVTVTDNEFEDCQIIKCEEVVAINNGWVEFNLLNAACGENTGSIELIIGNWTEPVNVEWVNEDNDVIGTGLSIDNLASGFYTANLEDANGCTRSDSILIVDTGELILDFELMTECDQTTAIPFVSGGSAPYIFNQVDTGVTGEVFVLTESGVYCFTVEDANGCIGQNCITVVIAETPILDFTVSCEGFIYEFEFTNTNGELNYYEINGTFISDPFVSFNIVELGYAFSIAVYTELSNCNVTDTLTLSNFTGLSYTPNPASCDTCPDGWIEVDVDINGNPNGTCTGCTTEGYGIYSLDFENVTDLNNAQELSTGTYIVGVLDNNGCIVGI